MKKCLTIVLLCLLTSTFLINAGAEEEKIYNNFIYTIENNSAVIKGFINAEEILTIPEEIDGYSVKKLEVNSGLSNKTKVIKVPKTVESFKYCSMIRQGKQLERVEVDKDNKYFKSINGVLYNKKVTKMLLYPRNNPIKKYKEPDTIVGEFNEKFMNYIRDYSKLNNLEEITFSQNKKNETVGYVVGCKKLKKVVIPKNVITVFGGDIDNDGAFSYCENLETVIFEKGSKTKYIPSLTFNNCNKLKNIKLPKSLKLIGYYAFYKCTSLKKITFPKKLKTIDEGAFHSCTNLKKIKLSKSIKKIKANAFRKTKLKKVVVYKSTKLSKKAFDKKCKVVRKKK